MAGLSDRFISNLKFWNNFVDERVTFIVAKLKYTTSVAAIIIPKPISNDEGNRYIIRIVIILVMLAKIYHLIFKV